jgi:Ca2+-binding RTX toxin-like protein
MRSHRTVIAVAALSLSTAWLGAPASAATGPVPTCHGRPATIVGTPARDVLHGTPGPDVIVGLGGNDRIHGFGGDDLICGGAGKDHLRAGPGDDTVLGGGGPDFENGGQGTDHLVGGRGGDQLIDNQGGGSYVGGEGFDGIRVDGPSVVRGGRGFDDIRVHTCGCTVHGGPGNDDISTVAKVRRSPMRAYGGPGDDDMDVEGTVRGVQVLDGGPGHDGFQLELPTGRRPSYRHVVVDLAEQTVRAGQGRMTIRSFEDAEVLDSINPPGVHAARSYTLLGTQGLNQLDDIVFGGRLPRVALYGRGGDDTLTGGLGDDLLDGGPGNDIGNGSVGRDRCVSIEIRSSCEIVRP